MATRANPKLIGAFVLGGVALFVIMILAFGSASFFSIRVPIVMYFEGDMSGLDIGAAVNFRGVRVGSVTKVVLQYDVKNLTAEIPVYAEIEANRLTLINAPPASIFHPGQNMPALVQRGLRAQLASESLVTGKLLVQLDFRPDTPVRLVGPEQEHGYYQIPTMPSAMAELQKSITGVVSMVASAKLPELIADLRRLIDDLDHDIKGVDMAALSSDARGLIRSAQQDINELTTSLVQTSGTADTALKSGDRMFQDASRTVAAIRPLIATLDDTAKRADALVAAVQNTIEPGSPLQRELITALREISNAARSARALTDNLERDPDSILFGKTGAKR